MESWGGGPFTVVKEVDGPVPGGGGIGGACDASGKGNV